MRRRSCCSRALLTLRVTLAVPCFVAACGGGSTAWGVDGSKPVSTLGADEAVVACEGFSDYLLDQTPVSEQNRLACARRGLSEAFDPAGCQAILDECMANPPPDVFGGLDCTAAVAGAACTATVAELESCAVAEVQARRERDAQIDCSLAGDFEELSRLSEPLPTPSECSAIQPACPIPDGDVLGGIRVALGGG